jgi:hypothetical protein
MTKILLTGVNEIMVNQSAEQIIDQLEKDTISVTAVSWTEQTESYHMMSERTRKVDYKYHSTIVMRNHIVAVMKTD